MASAPFKPTLAKITDPMLANNSATIVECVQQAVHDINPIQTRLLFMGFIDEYRALTAELNATQAQLAVERQKTVAAEAQLIVERQRVSDAMRRVRIVSSSDEASNRNFTAANGALREELKTVKREHRTPSLAYATDSPRLSRPPAPEQTQQREMGVTGARASTSELREQDHFSNSRVRSFGTFERDYPGDGEDSMTMPTYGAFEYPRSHYTPAQPQAAEQSSRDWESIGAARRFASAPREQVKFAKNDNGNFGMFGRQAENDQDATTMNGLHHAANAFAAMKERTNFDYERASPMSPMTVGTKIFWPPGAGETRTSTIQSKSHSSRPTLDRVLGTIGETRAFSGSADGEQKAAKPDASSASESQESAPKTPTVFVEPPSKEPTSKSSEYAPSSAEQTSSNVRGKPTWSFDDWMSGKSDPYLGKQQQLDHHHHSDNTGAEAKPTGVKDETEDEPRGDLKHPSPPPQPSQATPDDATEPVEAPLSPPKPEEASASAPAATAPAENEALQTPTPKTGMASSIWSFADWSAGRADPGLVRA